MTSYAVALLLSSVLGPGQVAQKPAEVTPAAIEQAVRDLGGEDFKTREQASDFLWKAGSLAIPALEKAVKSDDIEVRFRAQSVLEKVRLGILPGTPADIVELLEAFRKGDLNVKRDVLIKLRDKKETRLIIQLLKVETDPNFQQFAQEFFIREMERLLPEYLVKGDFDQTEQMLEQSAVQDVGQLRLATFWLLRGKLGEKIAKLKEQLSGEANPGVARQLVFCLRAQGDWDGAIAAAQTMNDVPLVISLAAEKGDWKLAARLEQSLITALDDTPVRDLGQLAAFHRLAGNQADFDLAVAALVKRSTALPLERWNGAKSLLMNEKPVEGIDLLRKDVPAVSFRLLAYRSAQGDALQLAGIEAGRDLNQAWYDALPSNASTSFSVHRFSYAADLMRHLNWLGRKDDAQKLRGLLLQVCRQPDSRQLNGWSVLAAAELRGGMEAEALEDASQALELPGGTAVLARLFPRHAEQAAQWWPFIRHQHATETAKASLERLMKLLRPTPPGEMPPEGWEELVAKKEEAAKPLDAPNRGKWLQMLGETCQIRGNRELALRYFREAAELLPAAGMAYADFLAEEKQWPAAAEAYRKVWEGDKGQILALYLCGKALIEAGNAEEGKQKLELASLLCLDSSLRRTLAYSLHGRGFSEDAQKHYELVLRTAPFESWHLSNAAENLGNLIVKTDPLRAADMWEKLSLYLLQPNVNPLEYEPLLDVARLIHKTRARAHLEAGRGEQGLAELQKCENVSPGNIDIVEDFVPLLKKQGQAQAARDLYERSYTIHAAVLEKFPDSANCRNNVAWMSAVSHERLDEALQHAQKAIELAPTSASFVDTLAEVYFQKGDRENAILHAKKALALAPQNKLFIDRLKKFETEELPKP